MDEDGISGDIARIHSGQDELYDNSRIQLFKNVGQAELSDEIKIVAGWLGHLQMTKWRANWIIFL